MPDCACSATAAATCMRPKDGPKTNPEGWLARLSAPAPSQSVKYPACNLLRNSKIYGMPSSSSNYAQRPRRERVEKSGDEGIGREAGGRPEGRSDCDI